MGDLHRARSIPAGEVMAMVLMEDIEEMLNEICYAPVPYETRVEMCKAVVKAVQGEELKNADDIGH